MFNYKSPTYRKLLTEFFCGNDDIVTKQYNGLVYHFIPATNNRNARFDFETSTRCLASRLKVRSRELTEKASRMICADQDSFYNYERYYGKTMHNNPMVAYSAWYYSTGFIGMFVVPDCTIGHYI